MTKSRKVLTVAAALAGLLAGGNAPIQAPPFFRERILLSTRRINLKTKSPTSRLRKSMRAKGKTPARVTAAARPATTAAKAKTPARARVVALPTVPSRRQTLNRKSYTTTRPRSGGGDQVADRGPRRVAP